MDRQRVRELKGRSIARKLCRTKTKPHIEPLGKSNIEQFVLGGSSALPRCSDVAVREVFVFALLLECPVITIALAVTREDDLVAPDNFLIDQAEAPSLTDRLQLLRSERALNPAINLVNTMWLQP